jgi:hypothetical protein
VWNVPYFTVVVWKPFFTYLNTHTLFWYFNIQLVAKKTATVRIKLTHFYNFSIAWNLLTRDRLELTSKFTYIKKKYLIGQNQIYIRKIFVSRFFCNQLYNFFFFLFDTVRIWEFFLAWTDFNKYHNLSKRNVKLILKILTDLEPLKGSSNKKTLYSTRSCVNWAFFSMSGPV